MRKQCSECHEFKRIGDFFKEKLGKHGVKGKCKACIQAYKAKNKLRDSEQTRKHNRLIKRSAFKLLGGCKCALCNETNFDRLNIDHVHKDGVRMRNVGKHGRGVTFYNQILQMSPAERNRLRVLCVRCNVLAGRYTDAAIRKMHLAKLRGLRYCPGCDKVKLPTEFHKDTGTIDGFRLKCRDCVAAYHKQFRQERSTKTAA